MSLSRLAGASNFCSNSLLPFLSILCIRSSQAILFQIFLYAFFLRFPWSILLPFPNHFSFHNLMYLRIGVSMHDMTMPPQMVLNDHILNLRNNIHPITKNISRHPINQSHPTHHPDHMTLHTKQSRLIRNSKLLRFATEQQNCFNTTLMNLPPLLQR